MENKTAVARRPRLSIDSATSYPLDSMAPSFLTSLPLDVRRLIYDDLFKHERPIMLVCDRTNPSPDYWVEARGAREHDQRIPWSLLGSCRQIYHEAVATLYSGNSWLFTPPLDEHEDINCASLGASLWMSAIGSNARLVQDIIIDVGPRCHDQCSEGNPRSIDLENVARLIWNSKENELRVTFQDSGRRLLPEVDAEQEERLSEWEEWTYTDTHLSELMNNLLRILAYEDILQMRRYSRFGRTIEAKLQIGIEDEELQVYHHVYSTYTRHFRILEQGSKIEEIDHPFGSRSSIQRMPPQVTYKVMRLCNMCSNEITVDLNARKIHGVNFQLGRLSAFKYCFEQEMIRAKVTVKTITSMTRISLDELSAIKEWESIYHHYVWVGLSWHSLILEFDVDANTTLEQLEIELDSKFNNSFREPSFVERGSMTIRKTRSDDVSIISSSDTTIEARVLFRRIFLVLSDMIVEDPDLVFKEEPSVWINGRGQVIRVVVAKAREDGTDYIFTNTFNQGLSEELTDMFDLMQDMRIQKVQKAYDSGRETGGFVYLWESLISAC